VNKTIGLFLAVLSAGTAAAQGIDLPSTFDLRDIDGHSYIGDVRNQGQCGSCWSFGTLAAAESTWNRAYNLYDDQAIDLSESFLVWSLSPLYDGMSGCNGANLTDPMDAMLDYGAPLETNFPYTITDPGDDLHWDASRYTFSSWYSIPVNDIETTKRVLHSIGAVTAAVLVEDAFYDYETGVFEDENRGPQSISLSGAINHAISLVGWDDNPDDETMGAWILRNSWDDNWGEDGYMQIRYTSTRVNLLGEYFVIDSWDSQSTTLENSGAIEAVSWSSGGTLNAHGIDFWGQQAGNVTNGGQILAEAVAEDELATGRGIYLWGGTGGQVTNTGDISGFASSQTNQAIAYAICFQGGRVENQGQLTAEAQSPSELALAYGIWASNGSNALEVANSGEVTAQADGGDSGFAYGLFANSRSLATLTNAGTISATADYKAAGVFFQGGLASLQNSGAITADANSLAMGVLLTSGPTVLRNSGTISGTDYSIYSSDTSSSTERATVRLILETGSDLAGTVELRGTADQLMLTGSGSEDETFVGVESLTMYGSDWSLSGDSDFGTIDVTLGRLGIDGAIGGETTIGTYGILGGNGTLTGQIASAGTIAPGHSIGHLTIDGDLTQDTDGTLEIEVGDGEADQLTVTGTAYLAGTLLVLPEGYATDGSYTFLDANSLDGSFDTIDSAAVLSAALSDGSASQSLTLDVTRNSYTSLATGHSLGLAEMLDDVRATAEADFADLLDNLDQAITTSQLNAALAELTPRIHGLATVLALENGQDQFNRVRSRMKRFAPTPPDDESQDRTSFWVEVPSHYARYGSDGGYFGATESRYGFMLGIEGRADNGLRVGLATAAMESRYEANDSRDSGEATSVQGYLYGAWSRPDETSGWRFGAAFGGGISKLEAERTVSFAGRQTDSSHDGQILGATFEGGYDWTPGPWDLGVSAGVSWVQLREDWFEESGADSADLDVRSRHSDSIQGFLGARLARPMEWARFSVEPALQMQWRHEFSRESSDLQAQMAGGGDYFRTPSRDLADDSLVVGTHLTVQLTPSCSANLGYDCQWQNDHGATDQALHLQITKRF